MKRIKKFFIILSMLRPVTKLELTRSRIEVATLIAAVKELEIINRSDMTRLAKKVLEKDAPKSKGKKRYEGRSYQ